MTPKTLYIGLTLAATEEYDDVYHIVPSLLAGLLSAGRGPAVPGAARRGPGRLLHRTLDGAQVHAAARRAH